MPARLPDHVDVPDVVARLAGAAPTRVVWQNELGGLAFEVGQDPDRVFIKWAPAGTALDLAGEAQRMEWARTYVTVPQVLEYGEDGSQSWLVTAALAGENAVSDRWIGEPATAVAAIGVGLRVLHDTLPVARCPFSWSIQDRLEVCGRPDLLVEAPEVDRLVVCHGDACAPNTLIGPDGSVTGHVDLGALGVADRWADLAIATWSTEWNYGRGWEEPLLTAYGIDPDPPRTRFYRRVWDLGP